MREPSPRTSRLAIAGGLAAMAAIGGGGFLLGRSTAPLPAPVAPPPLASPPPAPPPVEAPPEQLLHRPDLIALGAAAADAAASATDLPRDLAAMAGKRFELVMPFGCAGPAADGSELGRQWRYDEAAGALRIHVAPTSWPIADWWQEPPPGIEAMEGFWIGRPWSSAETCPSAPAVSAAPDADPVTLPGQTLGLVQLITADTPRQMRRDGKPYESVVRMKAEADALKGGLGLRLAGRIGRFPDGRPVRCRQPGGPEQRPVCLIAVELEEVAFRNSATGEMLASWQPTADSPARDRLRE